MTSAAAFNALLLALLALSSIANGYSVQRPIQKSLQSSVSSSSSSPSSSSSSARERNQQHQPRIRINNIIRRSTFLSSIISTTTSSCLLPFFVASSSPPPANAKEVDPALKGTKADPAFQACLGQCMYDCTKPKGSEQRSRSECLPECKSKCATSKEQLMTGTPTKKA